METLKTSDYDRVRQHQILYKAKTPPWKEAFREKCVQRVRNSRSRLVDKFRGLGLSTDDVVDVMMKEDWKEWNKEKALATCFTGQNSQTFNESEVSEFLTIMEEIQKELLEEEKKILEYYATSEAASLDSTVDWMEREEVICPLCQKNALHQNLSVIFCACGLRIDTKQDGLTLLNFRNELYEGLNAHECTCSVNPSFSLLQYCDITNLAITCEACNFMYIVI